MQDATKEDRRMDDEKFNMSMRKFLKQVGVTSQAAIEEVVREGEMPPWQYRLMHSGARLSDAERDELIAGVKATLGQ